MSAEATEKSEPLAPGLYVVATPIGNLQDITLRAVDILRRADVIYCEDTRIARRLTTAHGVATPLEAYHEHNGAKMRPRILARLQEGAAAALISDAGTPLISDPGYRLVSEAREAGLPVTTAPGPCAAIAALSICGAETDRFTFAGFLPPKTAARRRALSDLAGAPGSLIFYESGPRLEATLRDMAELLPNRRASIARELTKLHEEVRSGPLAELADAYRLEGPPKGEVTLVVHKPPERGGTSPEALDAALLAALADRSLRDAANEVAQALGVPRRQAYERALALKAKQNDPSA
ncbi:MAG: 16S rRNA (cytidine(1402)-2'-O)-methyltransferase [Pseudomonadota bacterium]